MEIRARQCEGNTFIETYDPSMNDGEGGTCRSETLNEGESITLTLPNVHDVTGIEVGEVVGSSAESETPTSSEAPQEEAPAPDSTPEGEGASEESEPGAPPAV